MGHPVRPAHPSGRPIRDRVVVGRQIWRIPDQGPVTPRLQDRVGANAVGFVHDFSAVNGDDQDTQ